MRTSKITQQITKRDTESFNRYLQEISKFIKKENLTSHEEVVLADRIKNGDKFAENELVERNLRFVVSIAKQYQNEGLDIEDLVSEGNIGLIKAAKKFNSEKNCKFISYAVWWIRQSILCYLSEHSRTVRLPLNRITQLSKIKKAQNKIEQELQRIATPSEIKNLLNFKISEEDIDMLLVASENVKSFDSPIGKSNCQSDEVTLHDVLFDCDESVVCDKIEKEDIIIVVDKMLKKIPHNHRIVLQMYYGLNGRHPKSIEQIAFDLKISKQRVMQMKKTAIRIMRSHKNCEVAKEFVK